MDIQETNERHQDQRDRINNGVIEDYLKKCREPVDLNKIACDLDLNVGVARSEVNKLVRSEKVVVKDAPMQADLSSAGLVYQWQADAK